MTALRGCPIDGCATRIPRTLAMCKPHWGVVPTPLKREVYRTYRAAAGSGEHLQALENAIAAVEGRPSEELFG